MIMKTKLMILWVMIGTLLAACYDDKGNYNYEAMNDITITFNERSYSAVLGEVVKIEPQLSFTIKEDQKALKFEWSFLGKIISRDRNLEFKADTTARDVTCERHGYQYCIFSSSSVIYYFSVWSERMDDLV